MIKLGKMKKALLEGAVSRADGALLPAPDGVNADSAACRRALGGLLKDGLAEERLAQASDLAWRTEGETVLSIFASPEGYGAVGATRPAARQGASPTRPGGKLGQVLDAIGRSDGASLDDLVSATGWQPHTTRAAITRLRQRGYDIALGTSGDRKVYRLAAA